MLLNRQFGIGATDSLTYTVANADTLAAGTAIVWTYVRSVSNSPLILLAKSNENTEGWEFHRRGVDGTSLRFGLVRATSGYTLISGTGVLAANKWMCVAVTWDINTSGNGSFYVSDLLSPLAAISTTVTLGSGAQASDAGKLLGIGFAPGAVAGSWDGDIAFVALYNRVLTLGDMRRVQYGRGLARPIFVAYPGLSTDAVDQVGNVYHGTVSGTQASNICLPRVPQQLLPTVSI